ncbi:MAG: hypothetical protein ACK5MK_02665 [Dysgonomonas sp.]
MYSKFIQSIYFRPAILLMVVAVLSLSFTTTNAGKVILPAGSTIALETISTLDSSTASVGQIVDFRVIYDVRINEKVVIKAGTLAKGQITRIQKNGAIGKAGELDIQIKSVSAVDGQDIFLVGGNIYNQGDSQQTLSIVLGVLVCLLCLFIKGKNAVVPAGTQVLASVASETAIVVE